MAKVKVVVREVITLERTFYVSREDAKRCAEGNGWVEMYKWKCAVEYFDEDDLHRTEDVNSGDLRTVSIDIVSVEEVP